MSNPDTSIYRQTSNGFWFKKDDDSGPYSWDGTTMRLPTGEGFKKTAISTAATTVVKNAAGVLKRLVFQGGDAGTVEVYDHASAATGTPFLDFDSGNPVTSIEVDAEVSNGIVIVTSAATKVTAIYR